jgi:hypothetical protein
MRAALGILLLTLAACGGETPSPAEQAAAPAEGIAPAAPAGDEVTRAAKAVAAARDAAAAQAALQAEGFTSESYEAAMYAIAGDPTKASAFVAASE